MLKTISESEYTTASAPSLEGQTVQWQTVEADGWVNPLYADVLSVEDLAAPAGRQPLKSTRSYGGINYEENLHKIAMNLRQSMVNRYNTFYFRYACPVADAPKNNSEINTLIEAVIDWAIEPTCGGSEGDYIFYQLREWSYSGSYTFAGDWYYYQLDVNLNYMTTAQQEMWVNGKVADIISGFGFTENTPQYVKIKTIYDYVVKNVVYDYTHLSNPDYDLQYTAYAALHNGTAVCQGYANLVYRLMWECGVPCRICEGEGNGEAHAWNLVALGDVFYYLDATWDSNYYEDWSVNPYDYFLIGAETLQEDHTHEINASWDGFDVDGDTCLDWISAEDFDTSTLTAADENECSGHTYGDSIYLLDQDGGLTYFYTCPTCRCMYGVKAYVFADEESLLYLGEIPTHGDRLFIYNNEAALTITQDIEMDPCTGLLGNGNAALRVANGAKLITTAGLIWGGPVSVSGAWDCYQESLFSSALTVEKSGCVTNYGRLMCLNDLTVKGELDNGGELICEKNLTVSGQLRSDVWITAEGTVTGSENIIYSSSPDNDFNGNKVIDSGDLLLLVRHVAKISILPDEQIGKNAQDLAVLARMLIA